MGLRTQPDRQQYSGLTSRVWWVLVAAALFTSACQALASQLEFSAANLLILDPVDSNTASTELLAVFSYQSREAVSFRIDLLDFALENAPSLLLLLDTYPGSNVSPPDQLGLEDRWEMVITIAPDQILSLAPENDSIPIGERSTASYDPRIDTIRLDIPLEAVNAPGPFEIAIVSMDAASGEAMDTIGPVRSDTPAPKPLPLILTFWNVFPSATPAQAQRSWDGAHNGPAGERFGLRHLLDAVDTYHVPVVLADIKQPGNLAGLQLLGAVPRLVELNQKALLSLPDVLPQPLCLEVARLGWPDWVLHRISFEAQRLEFPPSTALTCSPGEYNDGIEPMSSGYRSLLIHSSKETSNRITDEVVQNIGEIIPLTSGIPAQSLSFDGGLSLDLREQLAASIEINQAHSAFILSADFQNSFWGDPRSVDDSLHWIAAHPWIQPITLEQFNRSNLREVILAQPDAEYLDLVHVPDQPSPINTLEEAKPLLDLLNSDTLNTFTWQLLYAAFASPICQTQSATLENETAGASNCELLIDQTRNSLRYLSIVSTWEQLLARDALEDELRLAEDSLESDSTTAISMTDHWFAAIDLKAHQLVALFAHHPDLGAIPLIWNPAAQDPGTNQNTELEIDVQRAPDGNTLKIVFKAGASAGHLQLPIYLSPQHLNREQECLRWKTDTGILHLGCMDEIIWGMEIEGGSWSLESVLDSPARWNFAEDPNREMPNGHFLPIPYGLLTVDFIDTVSLIMNFGE